MTDSFETKFSILADAQINEKIPALKKHLLGFQVVASEENNSKAIGVLAYNIGKRLVYVPIFWLNGRVKGGDMMYLKSEDRFLPLGEIWVNFINSGRDFVSGESGKATSDQTGGASRVSTLDLNWLYSKRAGEVGIVSTEDIVKMSAQVSCPEVSLAKHLNMFSKKAAEALANTITKSPELANALFRHYSPSELFDVIGGRLKTASESSAKPANIVFYTDKYSKAAAELTMEEKQELVKDGIVVRDSRNDKSDLYTMRKANNKYSTPDSSGIYDILTGGYDLVTRTVILLPRERFCGCYACVNRTRDALVIDTEAKEFGRVKADELMAIKKDATTENDMAAQPRIGVDVTHDKLRTLATNKKDEFSPGSRVVFYSHVTREGIEGYLSILNGVITFKQHGCDSPAKSIVLTNTNGRLGLSSGTAFFIPKNTKVINLDEYKDQYSYGDTFKIGFGLTAPFIPSTVGLDDIKVASDGIRYSIHSSRSNADSVSYVDAVKRLVSVEGLDSKQAKELLADVKAEAANTNRMFEKDCVIKYADDLSSPEEGYGNDHTITREVFSTPGLSNREIRAISEASKTGVKEILDTKILSELAKSAYPLDKTVDYLPSFMNSIDKLGRLLFMFYWHNDAFVERYGKQNLDQIEDSLKDNLQSLGDLVIYLKEKTITAEQAIGQDQGDDLSKDMI